MKLESSGSPNTSEAQPPLIPVEAQPPPTSAQLHSFGCEAHATPHSVHSMLPTTTTTHTAHPQGPRTLLGPGDAAKGAEALAA